MTRRPPRRPLPCLGSPPRSFRKTSAPRNHITEVTIPGKLVLQFPVPVIGQVVRKELHSLPCATVRQPSLGASHHASSAHDRFGFLADFACDLEGIALLEFRQEEFHRKGSGVSFFG